MNKRSVATWATVLSRKNTVNVPPGMRATRLGQRVFFLIKNREMLVSLVPKGLGTCGRLMSSRIRRHVPVKRPAWRALPRSSQDKPSQKLKP
jgi:hypothetical protein